MYLKIDLKKRKKQLHISVVGRTYWIRRRPADYPPRHSKRSRPRRPSPRSPSDFAGASAAWGESIALWSRSRRRSRLWLARLRSYCLYWNFRNHRWRVFAATLRSTFLWTRCWAHRRSTYKKRKRVGNYCIEETLTQYFMSPKYNSQKRRLAENF